MPTTPIQYKLMAWLPGTDKVCVRDGQERIGYIDVSDGQFHEMFPLFYEAAVYKYGYHAVTPQVVNAPDLPGIVRQLQATHKA